MANTELKEAITLLKRLPVLWIPGIAGGILAASLWVTLNLSGNFFATRLLVIFGLVMLLFTTGMLVMIRNNEGNITALIYRRCQVLLPGTASPADYCFWGHACFYPRYDNFRFYRSVFGYRYGDCHFIRSHNSHNTTHFFLRYCRCF